MNLDMFKDAFNFRSKKPANAQPPIPVNNSLGNYYPKIITPTSGPPKQYYYQPGFQSPVPIKEDDSKVEEYRLAMLKWLTIAVGGGALLFIVWRIVLKFI